ncbi:hypothetical protein [Tateyamaria sp. ANG-S1]|uniref:hypothetical protein n=1 Tax=Tateyamaria sp. ANG-S1 TaxID=1577905 RepID=UPI00057F5EE0|nr:hypothetical protein [Tateyamaria sp. ANG-S1]KIC50967.1 hypothetical protein RA29_03505 [Tateyamaria sp. ANG-S1]
MTALSKYDRLEATGLWRASSDAQRREVIVSVGDATLVISDLNDRAITHWSLAAVEKGETPVKGGAAFHPDGDPDEVLELGPDETAMIDAINTLRRAVARTRPKPGRLRWLGAAISISAVAALAVFWLPGALVDHAMRVVPPVKEAEIGTALLAHIERMSGQPCGSMEARAGLVALAGRTGAARVVILPGGVREALSLPGGTVLLNRALVEDHEEPDVAAGYILVEQVRSGGKPPLRKLLEHAGPRATGTLLTTGFLPSQVLERYAEDQLSSVAADLPVDTLIPAFAAAGIRSTPYARARDISGEATLPLIEADPMAGNSPTPIMADRDWLQLQAICES